MKKIISFFASLMLFSGFYLYGQVILPPGSSHLNGCSGEYYKVIINTPNCSRCSASNLPYSLVNYEDNANNQLIIEGDLPITSEDITYIITVRCTGGEGLCLPYTESYNLVVHPSPSVQFSINSGQTICKGEQITLEANTGIDIEKYSFSGSFPNNFTHDSPVNPSTPYTYTIPTPTNFTGGATYSVTATSTHGCTTSATKSVTVSDVPEVSIQGPGAICAHDSAKLSCLPKIDGYTYQWSTGDTGAYILVSHTVAGDAVYTVTVTGNGCTAAAKKNLVVHPVPEITGIVARDDTAVNGGSGSIDVTVLNSTDYACLWRKQGVNGIFSPFQNLSSLHAGAYSLTVIDIISHCKSESGPILLEDNGTGYKEHLQLPVRTCSFTIYPNPMVEQATVKATGKIEENNMIN
ncbi:MAG: hypothetical protein ACOCVN_02015, partial [bacterium]